MASTDRYYLDSCVYIDMLGPPSESREHAAAVIRGAETGDYTIVGSELVRAEVAKRPTKGATIPLKLLDRLFDSSSFIWVAVDRRVALFARKIVQQHSIRGADAVHVATASLARCEAMLTADERLWKLNGSPLLGHLRIEQVLPPGQQALDVAQSSPPRLAIAPAPKG